MKNRKLARLLGCLAVTALSAPALAVSTWNFSSSGGCTGGGNQSLKNIGNSWSCTATTSSVGETTATATTTAWATTGSGATFAAADAHQWGSNGMGVVNVNESLSGVPDHSMDNNGSTDLISLRFGAQSVKLTSVSIGYFSNDSDISVLAYTGTSSNPPSSPPPSIAGLSVSSLVNNGWTLVGDYANLSTGVTRSINSANISSSWWLISAFNNGYGGNSGISSSYSDYVKLFTVAGSVAAPPPPPPPGVPEPGSLALLGIGLLGWFGLQRRRLAPHDATA